MIKEILSPREKEITNLLLLDLSNKQIAARLGISSGTVRNHISIILLKFRAKTRTGVVVAYARSKDMTNVI